MNERLNTSSSRETGTSFYDGDQIDTHVANPDLLTLEEVRLRRKQAEFDAEARRLMEQQDAKPELPATPVDRLTVMSNNLDHFRSEGILEGLPPAA
jgi:hypothetical protein